MKDVVKVNPITKYILAYAYAFVSLFWIMATYDKEQIDFMYDTGMIGTEEGQKLRKFFRKTS